MQVEIVNLNDFYGNDVGHTGNRHLLDVGSSWLKNRFIWPMSIKRQILLCVLACIFLATPAQEQADNYEWYLDEVVGDVFVHRNDFEYYYVPSAADMEQQRLKGEVSYFLNTPQGFSIKKAKETIDRLMASYDDIQAVGGWHETTNNHWKEFRHEKNKFRFSVGRKAVDEGVYYVSVTETANFYKSLGKKEKAQEEEVDEEAPGTSKPVKRNSSRLRKEISMEEAAKHPIGVSPLEDEEEVEEDDQPAIEKKRESRREMHQRKQEQKRQERAAKKLEQEQKRAEEQKLKEAEKLRKAEEKKKKQEEERLKKEEERLQREQAKAEQEQARLDKLNELKLKQEKEKKAARAAESRFHYQDIALWLSEKYDFTQTVDNGTGTTMFSTAVKDVDMAKLAIKNALKGSNARMGMPWRLNSNTQMVETGYTVDDHVLVFAIGKNDDGNITITIVEVSDEQFEQFKQSQIYNNK